ncbi:DUF2103 domain-containing protein [Desulfosporosinus sp. Sb-LF]|uniref:DUF2103 domain-containing protein n=1 Tax=Desulfosporosinus sp. Sb-LF TaxID=2560027 RepID=UPI00107F9E7B|nr:DUF2103 domain-containing protein [Desulfosporosinus sp. Sb-LF]TGE32333.1 hypothetical protein E4K68_12055 [Desulfosporosinus sp. Sb-LF]
MKYRRNKVKREHGIIQNALQWLENLSTLTEVTDIIPGVIDVNHSSERGIVYKYATQTGCKLLLKSNGSIQEAFVVTKNPECIKKWVEKKFPPNPPANESEGITQNSLRERSSEKLTSTSAPVPSNQRLISENKPATRPCRHRSKKNSSRNVTDFESRKEDGSNISDRLDRSTLKALKHLRESLHNAKIQNAKTKTKKLWQ